MSNQGEIIANELNTVRYEKLDFTVKKQSAKNIKLIKSDANNLAKQFISNYFDVIIADLPCSAE
jgi:16S rRNA C967 or C1407 C5-methylase (RsmB/RsmF family)